MQVKAQLPLEQWQIRHWDFLGGQRAYVVPPVVSCRPRAQLLGHLGGLLSLGALRDRDEPAGAANPSGWMPSDEGMRGGCLDQCDRCASLGSALAAAHHVTCWDL